MVENAAFSPPSRALSLGIARFNAGRYRAAALCFRAALRRKPPPPQALLFLRSSLRFARGPQRAVDEVRLAERCLERMREALGRGRLAVAFGEAERALGLSRSPGILEFLLHATMTPSGGIPEGACRRLLGPLHAAAARRPASPWPRLFRAHILDRLQRREEALRGLGWMGRLPGRLGWMRHLRGELLLHGRCDHAGAEREFRAALKTAPGLWKAGAYWAEAALCRGSPGRAFRIFDGLLGGIGGIDRAQALGWRGELLLWVGSYRESLKDLDASVRGGWRPALCWRGAARLQLGRPREALRDLDAALRLFPNDSEAHVWRGEARRKSGRLDSALADFDAAAAIGGNPFSLANRALVRAGRRDIPGMWSDVWALPPLVLRHFERVAGIRVDGSQRPEAVCAMLEAGLASARGIRRAEAYLFPVWMKRR